MTTTRSPYPHFRLNLEQQRKRAKELLAAARGGDAGALQRLVRAGAIGSPTAEVKLAAAQLAIARELRCDDWAALKRHIEAMTAERRAMAALGAAGARSSLDADATTLHVRCGSDIEPALREAGFTGDFYEHSYPYLAGPVREGDGALEQRAEFLTSSYGADVPDLTYAQALESLRAAERRLEYSFEYERVVIWSEHDCYDQLVLARLLGHYATHRRPRRLELVSLDEYPGGLRFLGLGQLPPEALRLLWRSRARIDARQLELGLDVWRALASPDPRVLAALARSGTPALPLFAPALLRHLSELPDEVTGLSSTERMALDILVQGERSLNRLFRVLSDQVDPLPGQGDLQVRDRVLAMERARVPLLTRRPAERADGVFQPPWSDLLEVTDTGRAVLRAEIDYLSLAPPRRWVGGVEIGTGTANWRWRAGSQDVALRSA